MPLKTKLKQVPTKPGMYRFKDKKDTILYIGKLKNQRNRVRSYFPKTKHQLATLRLSKQKTTFVL